MVTIAAAAPASERPIFVFAQHRGGGTLMTRLLNCHPDIVVWNEHAGFINHLAEADLVLRNYEHVLGKATEADFARFLGRDAANPTEYSPWLSPMTVDDFPIGCRAMIQAVFTRRVRPDQRWGFKEIRYHRPLVAQFLARLFPAAQFILLTRGPVELCVSNILVEWSLAGLLAKGVQHDPAAVRQIVEDCLYAIVAMQTNMAVIQQVLPDQTVSLSYETLVATRMAAIGNVMAFLGQPTTPEVQGMMRIVLDTFTGVTEKPPAVLRPDSPYGLLVPDHLRATAANLLPRVTQSIATHGIDLPRLRRLGAHGRYSYLLGDPESIETGSSAIF